MKSRVRGYRPDVFDRSKSLEQLEGQDWGEPNYHSHLVRECHRLHRVPLRDLTLEDLRIMIGQSIGLKYLVYLALERLQADPYAGGDFFPGDLLVSMLHSDSEFWRRRPELRQQLEAIAERVIGPAETRPANRDRTNTVAPPEDFGVEVAAYVAEAYAEFKRRQTSVT